ncbi:adaptin-binding domain-containing protein [Aspergillus stella-maris]|uniref:adaptin-binding domain-containing protein n=1 Tax=Aspergillus stella-maris TaxID=1810926 RepID=UPI003CCD2BD5
MTSAPSKPRDKKPQAIRNSRRLLILSPSTHAQSLIPSLLKQLTGHGPSETQLQTASFAGYTTHPPLRIENRYYTAEVPVWVDEVPFGDKAKGEGKKDEVSAEADPEKSKPTDEVKKEEEDPSAQWSREFSSGEAQVVRDAIGAVMISIRNPQPSSVPDVPGSQPVDDEDTEEVRTLKSFVKAVGTVRGLIEEERGEIGSVPGLLVLGGDGKKKEEKKEKKKTGGSGEDDLDLGLDDTDLGGDGLDAPFSIGWWEDQLCEIGLIGFEVLEWDGSSEPSGKEERNQYGELQGIPRVKELLETHEWSGAPDEDEEDITGLPSDDDELERELLGMDTSPSGFNREVDQLQREMVGLRFAIEKGGGSGTGTGTGTGDFNSADEAEGDEELRVDAVEALLTRMRAIKGLSLHMSAELPEQDRKRFAAKAVRDIMKEI